MEPIWTPSPERIADSNLTSFAASVGVEGFDGVQQWSLENPGEFWAAVWDQLGVIGERGSTLLERSADLPANRFLPDSRLNVAETLLAGRGASDDAIAMIFRGEDPTANPGVSSREITWGELRDLVGRVQGALRRAGVGEGDRVAAWMPNIPETYAIMLAAASARAVSVESSITSRSFAQSAKTTCSACSASSSTF